MTYIIQKEIGVNKVDVQSINFAYPSAKQSLKSRVVRFTGNILSFFSF